MIMRLINIHTFQLKEFSSKPPAYAILSHRWTNDEISYKDFIKDKNKESIGYAKVKQFCDWVKRSRERDGRPRGRGWVYLDDVDWVWVDTCCIDKRSSAELSEAINSMWKWYEEAAYCVAYLESSDPGRSRTDTSFQLLRDSRCDWFYRGWTLQELLAPRDVVFCSRNWEKIGHRSDEGLARVIGEITGIPYTYLQGSVEEQNSKQEEVTLSPRKACVAKKLSWAQRRRTTREEDTAYCLIGLLGVNMPLLYGEGGFKAFQRLQEELIRQSDDESVFAIPSVYWRNETNLGILGSQPLDFAGCEAIEAIMSKDPGYISRSPYAITNKGLQFEAQAVMVDSRNEDITKRRKISGLDTRYIYLVPLNCRDDKTSTYRYNYGQSPLVRKNRQCVVALVEDSGGMASRISFIDLHSDLEDLWNKGKEIRKRFLIKLTSENAKSFGE